MSSSFQIASKNVIIILINVIFLFFATKVQLSEGGFACLENPCAHGICIDDINSPHQCYCQNGFTGYSCEQNWDECQSWGPSPCLNGGTCLDGIASFNCSCPEPFAGRLCEINLSTCDEVYPCQNNGTCSYNPGSAGTGLYCLCPPGFKGVHCEEDVSVCNETLNICLNGGKCIDGIGKKFYCQCEIGWEGRNCEISIDECASSPCLNDGVCVDKVGDFSCACPFSYTGKACETELEICSESPCQNDGFCLEEEGKKVCYCIPDFHGEFCEEQYDECDTPINRCLNGGTCIDGVGAFTCSCPPRFFGSTCQCPLDSEGINATLPECSNMIPDSNGTTIAVPTLTPPPPHGRQENISISMAPEQPQVTATIASQSSQIGGETSVFVPLIPTPTVTLELSSSILLLTDSPYDPGGKSSLLASAFEFGTVSMSPSATPPILSQDYPQTSTISSPALNVQSVGPSSPRSGLITDFVEDTALVDIETTPTYDPCPTLSVGESESGSMVPSTSPYFSSPFEAPERTSDILLTVPFPASRSSEIISIVEPSTANYPRISPTPAASESVETPLSSIFSRDGDELITEFPPQVSPSPTLHITLRPSQSVLISDFDSSLWEIPDSQAATMSISTGWESRTVLYPSETLTAQLESSTMQIPPVPTQSLTVVSESQEEPRVDVSGSSYPFVAITPMVSTSLPVVDSSTSMSGPEQTVGGISYFATPSLSLSTKLWAPSASEGLISQTSRGWVEGGGVATSTSLYTPVLQTPVPSSSVAVTPVVTSEFVSVIPTATATPSPTTTPPHSLSDPCENYCSNNAKCLSTTIEPICICPFMFTGVRCEEREAPVEIPSFAGDSFLKYELPRASGNIIDISAQMATVVPDGILVYSAIGRIYAFIYIQNGLVTLHFSCGAQSMNFVETRTRVDNGFNFTISFRLENMIDGNGQLRCVGQVSLNDSYSMRGEQVVDRNAMLVLEQPMKKVFLGGLDHPELYHNDDIIRLLPGFRGCVYRLKVNQEILSMYDDAKDGRDISECSTFGCVVDPCAGHSRCVSSNQYPFWECICPPGFEGSRCNIRGCSANPCKNGATCTTVLNDNSTMNSSNESHSLSSTSKCLCPLGFSGKLCQSRVNITKPSFHGTPDYSSFVAYDPIPRFADWMQLKFHFITHNMSQIALLMFTGSESESGRIGRQQLDSLAFDSADNEQASDFFAISFLQGFIALTWNLGSGTQRITSPSRIDNRLNVHTLFAGRHGRQAWLKVDGMRNTTGKTPGPLYRLNVYSDMFVGGHEVPRFEGLPHDIPLHSGFQGCIFDLGFRVKNKLYLPRPLRGRNVINCYEDC